MVRLSLLFRDFSDQLWGLGHTTERLSSTHVVEGGLEDESPPSVLGHGVGWVCWTFHLCSRLTQNFRPNM